MNVEEVKKQIDLINICGRFNDHTKNCKKCGYIRYSSKLTYGLALSLLADAMNKKGIKRRIRYLYNNFLSKEECLKLQEFFRKYEHCIPSDIKNLIAILLNIEYSSRYYYLQLPFKDNIQKNIEVLSEKILNIDWFDEIKDIDFTKIEFKYVLPEIKVSKQLYKAFISYNLKQEKYANILTFNAMIKELLDENNEAIDIYLSDDYAYLPLKFYEKDNLFYSKIGRYIDIWLRNLPFCNFLVQQEYASLVYDALRYLKIQNRYLVVKGGNYEIRTINRKI